mmetsp:Transcript_55257/g.117485  ORF Transcript_55257/g.117485 Transcript_55257/m.117485 type:complete len:84 (+) Transcript_55257:224-475(+)
MIIVTAAASMIAMEQYRSSKSNETYAKSLFWVIDHWRSDLARTAYVSKKPTDGFLLALSCALRLLSSNKSELLFSSRIAVESE